MAPALLLLLVTAALPQASPSHPLPEAAGAGAPEEIPPPPEASLERVGIGDSPEGWFLYAEYEGPYREMGERFLPLALYAAAARLEGSLFATYPPGVETLPEEEQRARIGILLAEEPDRVPGSYALQRVRRSTAVLGGIRGAWGDALLFLPALRSLAEAEGLVPEGPVWAVYRGTPEAPGSLWTELVLPVRQRLQPAAPPAPGERGPER